MTEQHIIQRKAVVQRTKGVQTFFANIDRKSEMFAVFTCYETIPDLAARKLNGKQFHLRQLCPKFLFAKIKGYTQERFI